MSFRIAATWIFAGVTSIAQAESCVSLIELSKSTSYRIVEQSAFDSEAATFCSAYSRNASTQSDSNFGASYKFFSASYGQDNASTESIASKVCSSNNRSTANADAYRDYVNTIAPGAYDAYKTCITSKDGLQFSVDVASILPTEFTLTANYKQITDSPARLQATPSDGLKCTWDGAKSTEVTLGGNSGNARKSTALRCTRVNSGVKSYVTIINKSGAEQLTLPWRKYNKDGDPVDTIASLEAKLQRANESIAALNSSIVTIQSSISTLGTKLSNNTVRASIPTAQMGVAPLNGNCNSNNLSCIASISRYCQSQGFAGGFPQEWDANNTIFVCSGK